MVDFDINLIGMNEIIPNELNFMNLQWQMKTPQTEKSKDNQDMYTGIYYQYFADKDDIDYLGYTTSDDNEKIKNNNKIEVLSIASLMSEAIKRIANSNSVSDLFN